MIKNTQTKQNLVSRDFNSRFTFIGKQDLILNLVEIYYMNGNVSGNKTSHSRQAFRTHIRPFPFSSGQP